MPNSLTNCPLHTAYFHQTTQRHAVVIPPSISTVNPSSIQHSRASRLTALAMIPNAISSVLDRKVHVHNSWHPQPVCLKKKTLTKPRTERRRRKKRMAPQNETRERAAADDDAAGPKSQNAAGDKMTSAPSSTSTCFSARCDIRFQAFLG
jgi:hypothetical protein